MYGGPDRFTNLRASSLKSVQSRYFLAKMSVSDRTEPVDDVSGEVPYRRLHLLLQREGMAVNRKKLYRLYKEERLTVRKRGERKRALGHAGADGCPAGSQPALVARLRVRHPGDGRRFRILCVIDDFSRECLATVVDNLISGDRVARELDAIAERRGYPCPVVSDNGTELTLRSVFIRNLTGISHAWSSLASLRLL
jgi:putative transposase